MTINPQSIFLASALLCAQILSATGATRTPGYGLVVDPSGSPVPNAVLLARKVPIAYGSARLPFRFQRQSSDLDDVVKASSGPDGTFVLAGLLPARYSICAEFPDSSYLNTCIWSGDRTVNASIPGDISNIKIVAQPAAIIRVDIADLTGVLGKAMSAVTDNRFGTPINIGVKSGDSYYTAKLVSSDSGGRHYAIAVPFDQPLRLWLYSRSVGFLDQGGIRLANSGTELPFLVRKGLTVGFWLSTTSPN